MNRVVDGIVPYVALPTKERECGGGSLQGISIALRPSKGSVESSGCRTAWDAATFRACARACALVGARPRSMIFRSEITSQYQPPAEPFRETL
jgi:hypothetical protein